MLSSRQTPSHPTLDQEFNERLEAQCRIFCETTKRLPPDKLSPFSCDWENWKHTYIHSKSPIYYDLTTVDMLMKCVYGLTPPIRPVAYLTDSYDDEYVFEADGKYYFCAPDAQDLWQIDGVQNDEAALDGWAVGKLTKIKTVKDGFRKLGELEREQMELARNTKR